MTLFYDNKGVLRCPSGRWAALLGMWSPGGWMHCDGGMEGQFDVGLVLRMSCGALHCSDGGLRLSGGFTSLKVCLSVVHWGPWLMMEVLGSLKFLLVLWPCQWGFPHGGPQCRALCLWAFLSYSIAGAWALWQLNRENFSTVFCGMFSQVPTVARGKHMTNHIKK